MSSRQDFRGSRDRYDRDNRDRGRFREPPRRSRSRSPPRRGGDRPRDRDVRDRDRDRRVPDRRDHGRDDRAGRDRRDDRRDDMRRDERRRGDDKDDRDARPPRDREQGRGKDADSRATQEREELSDGKRATDRPDSRDARSAPAGSSEPPTSRPREDSAGLMEEGEEGETMDATNDDDAAMMEMMGLKGFGTTKGKHVEGNQEGTVDVKRMRTWRQYMNRRGGFNRPLDKIK